jgi:hypothetical protein
MRTRAYHAATLLCVFLLLILSCTSPVGESDNADGEDDQPEVPDPILDRDYRGTLRLQFTNSFPAFDETADCEVYVDHVVGIISIDPGTLDYIGDETDASGLRMRRDGTLSMIPRGWFEEIAGVIYVQVSEDTSVSEHMQVWAPDGTQVIDEMIDDFWDGGLSFDFLDCQAGGSVCQVVTPQGSAIWTLGLTPDIVP